MEQLKELLILALTFSFTFLGMWLRKQIINLKSRRFQLIEHSLFSSILTYIREIKSWNIKENRQVFLDAFIIKLKIWSKNFIKLALELQKAKYNNSKLELTIINTANTTISDYITEWKVKGIPLKVIQKINEKHNVKVEIFIEKIKAKCHNNDMYPAFMLKIISIFDVLELLLSETINDLNDFIFRNDINGYYKETYYKGVPINDQEYQIYQTNKK